MYVFTTDSISNDSLVAYVAGHDEHSRCRRDKARSLAVTVFPSASLHDGLTDRVHTFRLMYIQTLEQVKRTCQELEVRCIPRWVEPLCKTSTCALYALEGRIGRARSGWVVFVLLCEERMRSTTHTSIGRHPHLLLYCTRASQSHPFTVSKPRQLSSPVALQLPAYPAPAPAVLLAVVCVFAINTNGRTAESLSEGVEEIEIIGRLNFYSHTNPPPAKRPKNTRRRRKTRGGG